MNAVMREEACEMAGRVAQGVSERVTRDNTRRLVKRVVEHFLPRSRETVRGPTHD